MNGGPRKAVIRPTVKAPPEPGALPSEAYLGDGEWGSHLPLIVHKMQERHPIWKGYGCPQEEVIGAGEVS